MSQVTDSSLQPASFTTPIQRVRGTNDFLPAHEARLRKLEGALRERFARYGYEGIQTPILEPLDLFLRKSGDEIVARMYAFSHWNRRLCLRPELTASVMRAYVGELQGRTLPVRLSYSGPTFRYERPSRGRYRQFTQVGLELIGVGGAAADAEILHLACGGLDALGVKSYRLVVGHLGVVLQMLRQLGMSEHAQGLILDLMEPLTRGRLAADDAVRRVVELLGGGAAAEGPDGALVGGGEQEMWGLADLAPDQAAAVVADVLRHTRLPLAGGSRQPREIIERLLARAHRPDPTAQVRTAVEFVLRLHEAAGGAEKMSLLHELLEEQGLSTEPLHEMQAALDLLRAYGVAEADGGGREVAWEVDLSLARGLRYYTGLVFEVYVDTEDGPLQVCGGGRYDDLIRALGARESIAACGFSFGLERLDLIGASSDDQPARLPRVLVVAVEEADHPDAIEVAGQVRAGLAERCVVEQSLRFGGLKAALRHADRSETDVVLLVGDRERREGTVALREMRSRAEQQVTRGDLTDVLRKLLT